MNLLPLAALFRQLDSYPPQRVVGYRGREPVSWAQLCTELAHWQVRLASIDERRVAVYHSDGLTFLALLGALWRLGKTAVIPANRLDASLDALSELTRSFVGEFGARSWEPATSRINAAQLQDETGSAYPGDEAEALIVFTSGSSGSPQPNHKQFAALDAELRMLTHCWGKDLRGTCVLGTVSHQHMYGLPFRLLWPLATGTALVAKELSYFEQLLDYRELAPLTLISSPAHLERIPEHLDRQRLQGMVRLLFSAGAALSLVADKDSMQRFGCAVTEIYGSTETGALAWRRQQQDPHWRPLPGVSVRIAPEQQVLMVISPALETAEWFATGDLGIAAGEGTFRLGGRIDSILKVGGKRVSVTAIETALLQHPWVEQAKVVQLAARNSRLGAVVVPNALGKSALVDRGRQWLNAQLRDFVRPHVEAVAIPRYWRYVAQLPMNAQAKVGLTELTGLFAGAAQPKLPEILDSAVDPTSLRLRLRINQDLYYLSGHFPGNPVLPGVAQLAWVFHFARQHFGELGRFERLEKIKFQQVITPGTCLELALDFEAERRKLLFSYSSGELRYSSGQVVFGNDV